MHTIKGIIKQLMEEQTGTSKAGREWSSREFVLEVNDEGFIYSVPLKAFGMSTKDLEKVKVGDAVKVDFRLGGHEFNGRWYQEINVRGIHPEYKAPAKPQAEEDINNDLPF